MHTSVYQNSFAHVKVPTSSDMQDHRLREILKTSALGAEWIPVPEKLFNGDEIGFDIGDVSFRGNVEFNEYGVTLHLTSPVSNRAYKAVFYSQQTFFKRNPPGASLFIDGIQGGPATDKCIETAKDLLIGLYSDWVILQSKKTSIRKRLSEFGIFAKALHEREQKRIAPIRERLKMLSIRSGEIKGRLKRGEISQQEYVAVRRPIHDEIVALMKESHEKDPFRTVFSDELADCHYAVLSRELIESI